MRCPECLGSLHASHWVDGAEGYFGVHCRRCNLEWRSASFAEEAFAAEQRAVRELLEHSPFPDDALTPSEFEESIFEPIQASDVTT